MSDNAPSAPGPNRPRLDIPREVTIPGTKIKLPTWLLVGGAVLLMVLLVAWRRRTGAESYASDILDEEGALSDEIVGEAGSTGEAVSGAPEIGDIPAALPAMPAEPLSTVPELAGYEDQPIPPSWDYSQAPVYPSYYAEVAPGAPGALAGARASVSARPAPAPARASQPGPNLLGGFAGSLLGGVIQAPAAPKQAQAARAAALGAATGVAARLGMRPAAQPARPAQLAKTSAAGAAAGVAARLGMRPAAQPVRPAQPQRKPSPVQTFGQRVGASLAGLWRR